MKRLYCKEFKIGRCLFLAPCLHWTEWFIPGCLDIDSMGGKDLSISLKILCFSIHFIICWE